MPAARPSSAAAPDRAAQDGGGGRGQPLGTVDGRARRRNNCPREQGGTRYAGWRAGGDRRLATAVALRRRFAPGRDVVDGHHLPLVLHLIWAVFGCGVKTFR